MYRPSGLRFYTEPRLLFRGGSVTIARLPINVVPWNYRSMTEIATAGAKSSAFMRAETATEAAVRRLMDAGQSRKAALALIDDTLYKVVAQLNRAGIGQTSFLQQMNLAAGMALNAIQVKEANEDDADRK